jgi:serine/threonine protein kinase
MEGRVVGGAYRVGEVLGRGGMGVVHAAVGPHGEPVAVKFLRESFAGVPDVVARFRREAKIAARIQSPFVARLLGAGKDRDGKLWIAFERLSGESLEVCVERRGRLPLAEVGWIIDNVLRGLAAAHAVNVVHRDIKPGNVFLESSVKRARILDFGVSKLRVSATETGITQLTDSADTLGTLLYMAPEQMAASDVDARADLYSVGLVAFASLTGTVPFGGRTTSALLHSKRTHEAFSLAHVTGKRWPDDVERFLRRMLALDPDERFSSAKEALAEWSGASRAVGPLDSMPPPHDSKVRTATTRPARSKRS